MLRICPLLHEHGSESKHKVQMYFENRYYASENIVFFDPNRI